MAPSLAIIPTRLHDGAWLDRRRVRAAATILLVLQLAGFLFIAAGTHGWLERWIGPLTKPTTTDFVSFYAAGALADAGTPALAYDHAAHLAAEERVVGAILRNLSILLGQPFQDLRALNRYRKSLGAAPAAPAPAGARS